MFIPCSRQNGASLHQWNISTMVHSRSPHTMVPSSRTIWLLQTIAHGRSPLPIFTNLSQSFILFVQRHLSIVNASLDFKIAWHQSPTLTTMPLVPASWFSTFRTMLTWSLSSPTFSTCKSPHNSSYSVWSPVTGWTWVPRSKTSPLFCRHISPSSGRGLSLLESIQCSQIECRGLASSSPLEPSVVLDVPAKAHSKMAMEWIPSFRSNSFWYRSL